MKCVYSPQFDRNGTLSDLSLWVSRPADIEVLGSLSKDPRFSTSITSAAEIQDDTPTNSLLCVRGVVHSYEPGKWVTLWDATGQIMVQCKQSQPLRFGDQVEAIGYPYVVGVPAVFAQWFVSAGNLDQHNRRLRDDCHKYITLAPGRTNPGIKPRRSLPPFAGHSSRSGHLVAFKHSFCVRARRQRWNPGG